ncbi:hybrid sensor histidine kinase/response regulator [[Phormidium] sp. ETS-05]|uniref:hybrid sensor histidine kinase/response regulator n=1 Tax=[Phormidium] sp. ETS-05 TaxID=222819 RepID=UPI0018EED983|nr:hybrid sensor histidine kinase/response regulator [[Phormidium] sp. ETS-05]
MNTTSQENNAPLILVVDDDRTTRMMLRRAMESEGYRVAQASNGLECLESCRHLMPNMVLLDAKMPVMDGFECCSQLQNLPGGKSTPVLMITGLEDEESVERAFSAGARDYITKPIHWAVLRYRVRRLLQEQQAEIEMRKALGRERELNDLRARIVTMVSHEYRTPLTTILSSAELLEHYGEKWSAEKRHQHLKRIQGAAKHMTHLVSDVVSISQFEAGELQFQPAQVNLKALCLEVVADLAPKGDGIVEGGNQNRIQVRFQGELEAVILDGNLLRQILGSVLENAVKYSGSDREVSLDVRCQDWPEISNAEGMDLGEAGGLAEHKLVIFRVEDRGIGIDPQELLEIFNPFYRGHNIGNIPGTGLGLAIAKKCAELHGGKIAVASTVGVGTAVTVTLPVKIPR